jgi:hypothetical protein
MALGRFGQQNTGFGANNGSATRVIELVGDSPEIVALALLRQLAQLEQQETNPARANFDRSWLLNAYAECLVAVRGQRQVPAPEPVMPEVTNGAATSRNRGRGRARAQA